GAVSPLRGSRQSHRPRGLRERPPGSTNGGRICRRGASRRGPGARRGRRWRRTAPSTARSGRSSRRRRWTADATRPLRADPRHRSLARTGGGRRSRRQSRRGSSSRSAGRREHASPLRASAQVTSPQLGIPVPRLVGNVESMATGRAGWSWLMGKIYGLVARNPAYNEAVFEEARLQPGERVLDIGSGAGHAMQLAAEVVGPDNVRGVDPTASLAATAEKRVAGSTVAMAVAEDLPFPDDSVDVAWSIASVHHWEDAGAGGGTSPPPGGWSRPHGLRSRGSVTPSRQPRFRRRGGGETQSRAPRDGDHQGPSARGLRGRETRFPVSFSRSGPPAVACRH